MSQSVTSAGLIAPHAGTGAPPASRYLAKLMGPVFLAIGIGMLANGGLYRAMGEQFLQSTALIYLSGLLALPVGIAIVLAHNVWTLDWRVIITVFGWLAAIGGVVRIVIPQFVQHLGNAIMQSAGVPVIAGLVVLALGGVLVFFGYYGKA